jgi:hypothetical protein
MANVTRSVVGALRASTIAALLSGAVSAQDLQEQVQRLEQLTAELQQRLDEVQEQQIEDTAPDRYGMGTSYGDLDVTFQLFGDVGFRYDDPAQPTFGESAFVVGSLDFFVTAKLGEHFQVLSETVGHASTDHEDEFGQERLWGANTFSDAFYAKLGLEHTPLSRWNRQYHHGAWLEPTVTRPLLAEFEGQPDAFLPMHNSGLELGGRVDLDATHLEYACILSNGRGEMPSDKQKVADGNDEKGVILSLDWVLPSARTRMGLAAQFDEAPGDSASAVPALTEGTDLVIGSAYVQVPIGPLETWAEVAALQDETSFDGNSYEHLGAFVQLLWPLSEGTWTPYGRIDLKSMDEGDPYLAQEDRDLDQLRATLGTRYDFASQAALKLEAIFGERDERGSGGSVTEEDFVGIALQLSWWI